MNSLIQYREYYGIRCQHKLHHHSCGDVKHGTWIRNGCNLCRCEDGNMLCVTSDIEGCGKAIFVFAFFAGLVLSLEMLM